MPMHKDYKDLIYNSIVYIPAESYLSHDAAATFLKCCCCNIRFDYSDLSIENHLQTSSHKKNIYDFTRMSFSPHQYQLDYKNIFLNSIGISLPSMLQSKYEMAVFSYCYKCIKVLSNGFNGIKQHLENGHKLPRKTDSFCTTCFVYLNNIQNHIDGSDFHSCMINDLLSYGREISEPEISNIKIQNIPSRFEDMSSYRKIFTTLLILEMNCQREYARKCRLDNLEIKWKLEKPEKGNNPDIKKKPIGIFKLSPSDDEYFKIKLNDQLVVYLDSERWSMYGTVKYMGNIFEDDHVEIELANEIGLKPHITFGYSITPKFTKTTFWRLRQALNASKSLSLDFQSLICNKNLDNDILKDNSLVPENIYTGGSLNQCQIEVIKLVFKNKVTIIHGPPGTGKTYLSIFIVINLLLQNKNAKILVCAPSNNAVDLLAKRLETYDINLVRIFSIHAENSDSAVKHLGLNQLALDKDKSLIEDYENYVKKNLSDIKYSAYRKKFEAAISAVLMERKVACTTLMTARSEKFEELIYDYILIDEASQSLEPETLIPIVTFNPEKVIFVGDHMQLGPLVMSKKAKYAGFGISMFERLIKQENVSSVMLKEQYRMHPLIALFPSIHFYESNLQNGVTEDVRTLKLTYFNREDKPVMFYNIEGIESKFGESLCNYEEAEMVIKLIRYLLEVDNVSPQNIGVITFYEGQNVTLHKMRRGGSNDLKSVMISTVDSFQGQEKDIIILSFVRSNNTRDIGFLESQQRLNVALTRAKFKLIMFGNRKTLEACKIYFCLFQFLDKRDLYYEEDSLRNGNIGKFL